MVARLKPSQEGGAFSIARLHSLGSQLLTYIRSNRGAIVNYGKRYRAGCRVATTLAESAVNSLVGKRMVKKQQMRWTLHGAHMLMQVRTAEINGELRDLLRAPSRKPGPNVPSLNRRSCAPPSPETLPVSSRLNAKRHLHIDEGQSGLRHPACRVEIDGLPLGIKV